MAHDQALLDWLLDTDPALRWQVQRDLVGAPPEVWEATRALVATEGYGAALLAHQDPDGQWAGGAYFPRRPDSAATIEQAMAELPPDPHGQVDSSEAGLGQPWVATTWSLNALREWGVQASALTGTAEKLEANSRWEYDDLPYWEGEVDCCINAFTLANGWWLGADASAMGTLAQWFVEHRLADGGWNCEWVEGSTRSSYHSTLNSLWGLLAHERAAGPDDTVTRARHAGEDYLLQRRLLYRLGTSDLVADWVGRVRYPLRWPYSALRATDYFRAARLHDGLAPDPRLADAIEMVRARRGEDGRWRTDGRLPGWQWFEVDVAAGEPSPWVTFYALRVLDWWDAAHG